MQNQAKPASLNNLQREIMHLMTKNPNISYDELAQELSKNRTTIMRNIIKLKDLNLLEREGSKKSGFWKVLI
jgi:ATP-dependent DNA helicase RecG